eukprot:gene25658-30989_t
MAIDAILQSDLDEKARKTLAYVEYWNSHPGEHKFLCKSKPSMELSSNLFFSSPRKGPESSSLKIKTTKIEYTLHGIATAESYAIDLFWDIIIRFHDQVPFSEAYSLEFYQDMIEIVEQEAQHFMSWRNRLAAMGVKLGDFPSNDALWQYAEQTKDNLLHRLAVINLTHEAKGLDSYLNTRAKLEKIGDSASIAILDRNIQEEVVHVAKGVKWFKFLCSMNSDQSQHESPAKVYQDIYRQFFKGPLRPPFNTEFREKAGMSEEWYLALAEM